MKRFSPEDKGITVRHGQNIKQWKEINKPFSRILISQWPLELCHLVDGDDGSDEQSPTDRRTHTPRDNYQLWWPPIYQIHPITYIHSISIYILWERKNDLVWLAAYALMSSLAVSNTRNATISCPCDCGSVFINKLQWIPRCEPA